MLVSTTPSLLSAKFHLNLHNIQRTSVVTFILCRSNAQTVSRRVLTAQFRFLYEAIPCGICGGRSVTGTDYCPNNSVYPYHYNSAITQHASSSTCCPLPEGRAGEAWELSIFFRKLVSVV